MGLCVYEWVIPSFFHLFPWPLGMSSSPCGQLHPAVLSMRRWMSSRCYMLSLCSHQMHAWPLLFLLIFTPRTCHPLQGSRFMVVFNLNTVTPHTWWVCQILLEIIFCICVIGTNSTEDGIVRSVAGQATGTYWAHNNCQGPLFQTGRHFHEKQRVVWLCLAERSSWVGVPT